MHRNVPFKVTSSTAAHWSSVAGRTARIKRVMDWMGTVFDQRTKPWFRSEFVPPSEFANWGNAITAEEVA